MLLERTSAAAQRLRRRSPKCPWGSMRTGRLGEGSCPSAEGNEVAAQVLGSRLVGLEGQRTKKGKLPGELHLRPTWIDGKRRLTPRVPSQIRPSDGEQGSVWAKPRHVPRPTLASAGAAAALPPSGERKTSRASSSGQPTQVHLPSEPKSGARQAAHQRRGRPTKRVRRQRIGGGEGEHTTGTGVTQHGGNSVELQTQNLRGGADAPVSVSGSR